MSNEAECKKYDNLMSLKLDGLLDAEKERIFSNHVAKCPECAPLWEAMVAAEDMLWDWVKTPLPVPSNFQVKVMAQVASLPAARQQIAPVYAPAIPQPTRPLLATGPLPGLTGPLTMRLAEWQGRMTPYVRWIAAIGLALTSMVGILLALIASGTLTFGGQLAGVSGAFRTFFQAADTWIRSLFVGIDVGVFVVAGLLVGLLALAGWQVAASYQRSLLEQRQNTGYLEALS